jgi:cohesin loading factor subunit SCC2
VEDIFEAEDSLPPDAGPSEWENSEFLSKLTTDPGAPLLNVHVITKLTKALSQIARPGKRIRLSTTRDGGPGTPRQAGLAEVDTSILSRILKLLSRSVKIGEDIDPFAGAPSSNAVTSEEPSKGKKSMKGSKAKGSPTKAKGSADGGDESGAEENENLGSGGKDQGGSDEVTEENIAALDHVLEMAKESVLAADCCIALLSADKLPKQVRLYFPVVGSGPLFFNCVALLRRTNN